MRQTSKRRKKSSARRLLKSSTCGSRIVATWLRPSVSVFESGVSDGTFGRKDRDHHGRGKRPGGSTSAPVRRRGRQGRDDRYSGIRRENCRGVGQVRGLPPP